MQLLKPDPIGVSAQPKARKHKKLLSLIQKHKKVAAIILLAVVLLAGVIIFLITSNKGEQQFDTISKKSNNAKTAYHAELTGKKVDSKSAVDQAVTAIMIENSPDSRPQSGLKDSGVVFEAIAEGGITRFLVLYQTEKPQLVGPVRSLRIYYVDWLTPFEASVAHVGGAQNALDLVRGGGYRDIDQFFNGGYYWRASDRWAPHNVYTSFEKLDALNQARGYTTSKFTGWPRQAGKAAKEPTATTINMTVSSPTFSPRYVYDKESNKYLRYHQDGEAHIDREQGQIAPDTVIAIKVHEQLASDGYREDIQSTGNGKAYIFQNGTVVEGTWRKSSREAQLEFLDASGKAIKLNRGQTWITAVPEGGGGVVWQ
ncbi:MAG: DUF3048 domain-containing protein [Candidatus Nomurabacteria bacterium]|jgi:hypothetical protein|nr:DUF3048 domain-containing protein [Candidatus Nomurabacteria bacterium]